MRVSQLDSHLLDQELFSLLSAHVDSALSPFNTSQRFSSIAKTLLRAIIWKIGIWDHGNTYGAQLQSLRYLNLTPPKKIILGLVSVLGPLIQDRIGGELHGRWRTLAAYAEGLYEVLAMANFISYIAGARYDSVLHRILRIQLRPISSAYRAVSFEFLNRQLIWSQFTEFLLVFLPLLHLPRLRRKFMAYLPHAETQQLGFLPKKTCAICYADGIDAADIVNPYRADCGDLYCYGCLVSQITLSEGEGWECLRCGSTVKGATPWVSAEKEEGTFGLSHLKFEEEQQESVESGDESDSDATSSSSSSSSTEDV